MLSDPRSTPARFTRLATLLGTATALWVATVACELGDGDCLRMSDCDVGYACVEGTCRSNRASDAPPSTPPPDAGPRSTTRADAATDVVPDAADANAPEAGDAASPDASALDASGDASADASP